MVFLCQVPQGAALPKVPPASGTPPFHLSQSTQLRRIGARPTVTRACQRHWNLVFSSDVDQEQEKEQEEGEEADMGIDDDEEEDLLQFPDRAQWYRAKWSAIDQPEWNSATFIRSENVTPTRKVVVLEVETSREKVFLKNAYKRVGQKANVRVGNESEVELTVCSPPFPEYMNRDVLYKLRGDQPAGDVKQEVEEISIKEELSLFVSEEDSSDVFNLEEGTAVEVGPFSGGGLNLIGAISGIYRFPTIVIFCEGTGIATAKSLVEAPDTSISLIMENRVDVRMYYKVANDSEIAFRDKFADWENLGCKVITTTSSFQDAFDDDDTLTYEPSETAAIILTGGDKENEKAALEVCKEAEIDEIVCQSEEQDYTNFLDSGLSQI